MPKVTRDQIEHLRDEIIYYHHAGDHDIAYGIERAMAILKIEATE